MWFLWVVVKSVPTLGWDLSKDSTEGTCMPKLPLECTSKIPDYLLWYANTCDCMSVCFWVWVSYFYASMRMCACYQQFSKVMPFEVVFVVAVFATFFLALSTWDFCINSNWYEWRRKASSGISGIKDECMRVCVHVCGLSKASKLRCSEICTNTHAAGHNSRMA